MEPIKFRILDEISEKYYVTNPSLFESIRKKEDKTIPVIESEMIVLQNYIFHSQIKDAIMSKIKPDKKFENSEKFTREIKEKMVMDYKEYFSETSHLQNMAKIMTILMFGPIAFSDMSISELLELIEAGYKPKDKHEDMIKKYIESIELCFDDKK